MITSNTLQFHNGKFETEGKLQLTLDINGESQTLFLDVSASRLYGDPKKDFNANCTKLYISDEITKNPLEDMFTGYRYNRPYQFYKLWVNEVLVEVFKSAGYAARPWKLKWAQRCGCSCPCSPGFLLVDEWGYYQNLCFTTIWINIDRMMPTNQVEQGMSIEAVGI